MSRAAPPPGDLPDNAVAILAGGVAWRRHGGAWRAVLPDGQEAEVWRSRLGVHWDWDRCVGLSPYARVASTCAWLVAAAAVRRRCADARGAAGA